MLQRDKRETEMHLQMVFVLFMLSASCCMNAFPVYPDIDGMQDFVPTDFNLVDSTMGFVPDDAPPIGLRQPRNMNSARSVLEEEINQIQKGGWWNGGKESSQDEAPANLIEDVKAILWKLAAADKLRTQAFVKADQSPQKPNKRACFWKYCVTN